MEVTNKIAYCQLVAQLLIIDGVLTDDERAFLGSLMNELDMDEAQREAVFLSVNVDDDLEDRLSQLGKESLKTLLTEVRAASAVDGDMSPVERQLIRHIQEHLDNM